MKNALLLLLTEADNVSPCPMRVLSILCVLVAFGLTIYNVVTLKQPFDIEKFGIGVAAIMATVGTYLVVKKDPKPGDQK